jgi:hypothetical protein
MLSSKLPAVRMPDWSSFFLTFATDDSPPIRLAGASEAEAFEANLTALRVVHKVPSAKAGFRDACSARPLFSVRKHYKGADKSASRTG